MSDGSVVFTVDIGKFIQQLAFDGEKIWVPDLTNGLVQAVKASDGTTFGSFKVGRQPLGVAFDGANIWVGAYDPFDVTVANKVKILRAANGSLLHKISEKLSTGPSGMLYDGSNIWIANHSNSTVSKISRSGN